jgi:hypothetical protein
MDLGDRHPEKALKPARATEVRSVAGAGGIKNFEDIMRVAAVAHRSRMLPKDVQTVEQAFWLIYNALDLGLPASSAFKFLYMTKGRRVAMTTRGQHAVIYRSGLCEGYREWTEGTGESLVATATTRRKGFSDPFTKTFSYKDAEDAGLLDERTNRDGDAYDSTYDKYLKDMLLARARERVFGVAFPDVTGGLPSQGVAEEIERNEAEAQGGRTLVGIEPGQAQRSELQAAVGPDPLLEAIRVNKEKPGAVVIPVEAQVIEPQKQLPKVIDPEAEPPEEEEEEEDQGELFG